MSAVLSLHVLAEEMLRTGHPVSFAAPGRSMEPTIHDGEQITVEPRIAAGVRLGEIVVYASSVGLRAHRLLRAHHRRSTSYTVRGDAADAAPVAVPAERILGVAVSALRGGRELSLGATGVPLGVALRRLRFLARRALAGLRVGRSRKAESR